MAGVFVLGEICGIREFGGRFRAGSLLLFILLVMIAARDVRSGHEPEAWFLPVLLLCFTFGGLRGAACCRMFQMPECEAFFSRYTIRNQGEFDYGLYLKGLGISSEAELTRYREGGLLASELPYFSNLGRLRQLCMETLSDIFPQRDAGIYQALLLGDKSDMDEGIRALYQSQGIAHLLAVSGLHCGIIGMGLYKFLRRLGCSLSGSGLLASAFVISYGVLTGAQGSAIRAVIMLLARFLSFRIGKSYDTLSALSLSALLLAAARPYILLQSGFQLSFGAILAISLLGENVIRGVEAEQENRAPYRQRAGKTGQNGNGFERRVSPRNQLHPIRKTLIISLSIQLFMLPVILYHFYIFPLYGIILNLIVIPLMSFVIASGLAALLTGLTAGFLAGFSGIFQTAACVLRFLAVCAGGAGHYILLFYEKLCELTKAFPWSGIVLGRPELWSILLFYAGLLFLFCLCFLPVLLEKRLWEQKNGAGHSLSRFYRMKPAYRMRIFFACSILLAALCFVKAGPGELSVTAIDVGQGDGLLIRYRDQNILIDGGSSSEKELGKYTLKPFLLSQGISSIDAAFVSHSDLDHMSGLLYLMEEVPEIEIRELILPEGGREQESYGALKTAFQNAQRNGGNGQISYAGAGEHFLIQGTSGEEKEKGTEKSGKTVPELICIYEGRGALPEANAHSPVLLLRYGAFSMIFTGDTTKGDEAVLAKRLRLDMEAGNKTGLPDAVTIYKAAHHGSKTSNSDAVLKLYQPEYALLSYGSRNSYGHPHREVTERLVRYGAKLLETGKSGQIRFTTDGKQLEIWCMLPPERS